jgi:hypothetical protein
MAIRSTANQKPHPEPARLVLVHPLDVSHPKFNLRSTGSQDFYKAQGAPAAAFQGNYGFNYTGAPMSVPYDSMTGFQGGQQQGSQGNKDRLLHSILDFHVKLTILQQRTLGVDRPWLPERTEPAALW